MAKVLVTGGTGFIGTHCVLQLLAAGHDVQTTVRREAQTSEVRALLAAEGVNPGDRLSFAIADLGKDDGWYEAVAGCDYVLHVASPLPPTIPKDENELIAPAREGTLRVLRAARDGGVKRVVLTSSFFAVGYGQPLQTTPFDEANWTNVEGADVQPYAKSKTLAERAAWQFIETEGKGLELTVVNPVMVFGPILRADYSTSILLVKRLLDGSMPAVPKVWFGVVDVRDVVDLHLRAMTHPAAAGERFLAIAGDSMAMAEIARVLKRLGHGARRVPRFELPNWSVRIAALFDRSVVQLLPELGRPKNATSAKAARILGWSPRPKEDAILATAESLLRLGLVS